LMKIIPGGGAVNSPLRSRSTSSLRSRTAATRSRTYPAVMRYGEGFYIAANRVREKRERRLQWAAGAVTPRWGLSLAGIALVLAVLGWFGAAPLLAHSAVRVSTALLVATAFGAFVLGLVVARDWRAAAGATLGLSVLLLLGLSLWSGTVGRLLPATLLEIGAVLAAAGLNMFALLGRFRRFRGSGDSAAVAWLRALEEAGAAPWFAPAAAAAAILPWTLVHGSLATLSALFLLTSPVSALFMPALATALETLVPRRRSLRELYGRG